MQPPCGAQLRRLLLQEFLSPLEFCGVGLAAQYRSPGLLHDISIFGIAFGQSAAKTPAIPHWSTGHSTA